MHSGEIDYYGASHNIAKSLGLNALPWTRGSWFHGWYQFETLLPELIIQEDSTICCNPTDVPNLVPTVNLEIFLKKNNFKKAQAIGAPFIYTHSPVVERIPGSLLIVPQHSLKETKPNLNCLSKLYLLDEIHTLKKDFPHIVYCLSGNCVEHGLGTRLNELKIPWITGAWVNDKNALQRIRNLFSQFEYLITNSIGSHIPYAGYCGCKISYTGNGYNRSIEEFLNIPLYKKKPHLIEIVNQELSLKNIRRKFPFLFNNIFQSNKIEDWSHMVLGKINKISPYEIAELIGWKIRKKDENSWEYIPGANPGLI
jgi:hypothetical protein